MIGRPNTAEGVDTLYRIATLFGVCIGWGIVLFDWPVLIVGVFGLLICIIGGEALNRIAMPREAAENFEFYLESDIEEARKRRASREGSGPDAPPPAA